MFCGLEALCNACARPPLSPLEACTDPLMRVRGLYLVGILLVACAPTQPTAAVSPAIAVSPTAQTTPQATSSPLPSPTVPGDLPITTVDFSCRLPVVVVDGGSSDSRVQAGFITFPVGQFVADPNAPSAVRHGDGDGFYDRAFARWVPVSPAATLPDGSAYAYVTYDSTFIAHIVDVATDKERTFGLQSLDRPAVLDFSTRGVYLYSPSALGGPGEGVWLLNPTTGSVTQVAALHGVWDVQNGKAFVARLDPRDKTVWPNAAELTPADSLVQVDLSTGVETELFYRAGAYPWMIGLASGRPLIAVLGSGGQTEIRLIDKPASDGTLIYSGPLVFDGYFQNYQGDGDRIWLGGEGGIYLFRPDRGLQRVFGYDARSGSGRDIHPGGFWV